MITKLKETIEKLVRNQDEERECLQKLYEAVLLKEYLKQNPQEKDAFVISYRKDKSDFLKTYVITNDRSVVQEYLLLKNTLN